MGRWGDQWEEGSLADPCSCWPLSSSSSSTQAAASASYPTLGSQHMPGTSPLVAPSKALVILPFLSSLQPWGWQLLHAVSNLWVSSSFPLYFFSFNNILVTNPFNKSAGFEIPGFVCFSDWTLTNTALWLPNWRIIIPCLNLNFCDYWDKLVLYVYWPHVFVLWTLYIFFTHISPELFIYFFIDL